MDILFLAIIALFIIVKLISILGDDGGNKDSFGVNKNNSNNNNSKNNSKNKGEVVGVDFVNKAKQYTVPNNRQVSSDYKEPEINDESLIKSIEEIRQKDVTFTPGYFLHGATIAYEMIVKAFNDRDKETLKKLLSPKVYSLFESELSIAESKGEFPQTTIVSIKESEISKIEFVRNSVKIFVEFISEEINLLKDKEGKIIDGDPSDVQDVSDSWVFERDLRSSNPNWTITAT